MKPKDVYEFFGGNQRNICRVLGLQPTAVNEWKDKDYVPEISALRLQHLTGGKLKVDLKLYDRLSDRKPVPYAEVRREMVERQRRRLRRERERQQRAATKAAKQQNAQA